MLTISVVIPCYNAGRYIGEALASVFAQSRLPAEVIVVDDGSTDDSVEQVLKAGGNRVRLIRTENRGPSRARNIGLDHATGDLIAFLDADDRWKPEMLLRCSEILEQEPDVQVIFYNFVRFSELAGNFPRDQFSYYPELGALPARQTSAGHGYVIEGDAFVSLVGFTDMPSWPSATVYRRTAIGSLRFDVTVKTCEAIDFFLKVTLQGGVAYDTTALVEVRRSANNLTKNYKALVYAKLAAFMRLQSCALSSAQRRALNRRIVRAYLDCAVASFIEGMPWRGVGYYLRSWTGGHIGWQQCYFGAKVPYLIIRSLVLNQHRPVRPE
jgi:glycosyltransferase involved in cell wall biosynthesis